MKFVYLNDSPLRVSPAGTLGIFAKSMTGLAEYAKRWPGSVIVSSLEPPLPADTADPSFKWADDPLAEQLHFMAQLDATAISGLGADLVMHSVLGPLSESLLGQGFRVIFTDDWSPEVRLEVGLVTNRGLADRARIRLGAVKRTRRLDRLAARADGFQCNGHSAAEHYRTVNASTHLFFDHRMRAADVRVAGQRVFWDGRQPLRIAYSGRLTEMKGVHLIAPFVAQLDRAGVDYEFTIIGAGNLEQELRRSAPPNVRFSGFMDFETEWKTLVRTDVDLMFLPHVQGDSASTYFESMGSGVPVLGFENRTLSPLLAAGGGGWAVKNGDVAAAADIVKQLVGDPSRLEAQARRGLSFMEEIPFESVFDGRVQHFLDVASR
ncbi:MAG: glycosyltransferase [Pseudoclavibacter sp.]